MSRLYRITVVVVFTAMALATMSYLSGRYSRSDAVKAVESVQHHLYGGGDEQVLRRRLSEQFQLHNPELRWWGQVVSSFYGVVQVTLMASEVGREVEFIWETGLISGELVPKNEAAMQLMQGLAAGEETIPSE